jgi:eukaryotic-like serine/threonine-protein kinase
MSLEAGTRLGPYEVLSPLGAGGMGEVYKARDTRLDREVAIKVLPARLSEDADALVRFEREAKAVAALSHPNILAIHDFGKEGSILYAVTELLEGESLRDRIVSGAIPQRRAVDYALQIAHGLAAAHGKGIVHRDFKPDNVFLTRDGRVKILDFGLAKSFAPGTRPGGGAERTREGLSMLPTEASPPRPLTEQGTVMGTVGYMSPEQVRGLPADARSDIFSFGVVLYEMLSGKRAFHRETAAETMTAVLKEEPEDLAALVPTLSPGLDRIVRHCLEKSPEQRFESARDIAFNLEALSDRSASSGATALPAMKRAVRPRMALAAAALVLATAGATYWLAHRPAAEPPVVRYLTYSGRDSSPTVSPDGRMIAFTSSRDGKSRIWLMQVAGGAEVALTSGPDDFARFSPDGSSILFTRSEGGRQSLYRIATVGGDERKIVDDAGDADWSPDGKRIVFLRSLRSGNQSAMEIDAVAADGSGVQTLIRLPGTLLAGPRWSPDGRSIAVSSGVLGNNPASVLVVPVDGGKPVRVVPPQLLGLYTIPAFTARRGDILYPQFESVAANLAGATSRLLLQKIGSSTARTLAWLPGAAFRADIVSAGKVVVDSLVTRSNLREVDLAGGRAESGGRWLTRGNSNDRQPSFSPDGERLSFSSNRGGNLDIWVLSIATGAIRRVTDDAAEDWDPVFTRDGKTLLWSSNRAGHFEIWAANADGSGARQLTRDGVDAENPVPSQDGRWIVYSAYNPAHPGIWKAKIDGSEARRLVAGNLQWAEISPDGRYVAACELKSDPNAPVAVTVYRFADGKPTAFRAEVNNAGGFAGRDRWMPDGKSLAFLGADEHGAMGIFVQDFDPERDTSATRRALAGFDPEVPTETFGFSPDGKHLVIEGQDQTLGILLVEGLEGVAPPARSR